MKEKLLGLIAIILVVTILFSSPILFNIKPAEALPLIPEIFGDNHYGWNQDVKIGNIIVGGNFTPSHNGIAQNITVSLRSTFEFHDPTQKVNCAIYFSSNGTLIANTTERTITTQYYLEEWFTFTFATKPNIYAGTYYYLMVWAADGTWDMTTTFSVYTANSTFYIPKTYTSYNWTNPITGLNNDYGQVPNIYCTYLTSASTSASGKYIKCYFNNVGGDILINFTAPINITSSSTFWNYVNSSAYDVYFMDEDNTTELYYETEYWNYASKSMVMWVRVPQINASNTDFIYLYYYNPNATNYTSYKDYTKVWTQWNAVWHLNEASGTNYLDSAVGYNGTAYGTPTQNITSVFDGGIKLNYPTTSDFVSCGQAGDFEWNQSFTIDVWYNTTTTGTMTLFSKRDRSVGAAAVGYALLMINGQFVLQMYNNSGIFFTRTTTNTHYASSWNHTVVTYDGSGNHNGVTFYVGGYIAPSGGAGSTIASGTIKSGCNAGIGIMDDAYYLYTNGLDEVRTIPAVLSANWTLAEWKCGRWTFVSFVYSKVWYNAESWNGRLYNYSWWNVEKWDGTLGTKLWVSVENWLGLLTPKLFHNAEAWNGLFHTLGFYNVELWNGLLRSPMWYLAEHWETNYTNILEQDVLVMADDATYHNWTHYVGASPYIKYTFAVDGSYIGTNANNVTEGYFSFQDFSVLQPTINFAQIKNITIFATVGNTAPPFSNNSLGFGIFPNGSYINFSFLHFGDINYTIADIKPYMTGMSDFTNLRMVINASDVTNEVFVDYVVLKVYYYPQILVLYNYPIFNFVEIWIAIFSQFMLIVYVQWGMLGLAVLFLVLSMIFLWVGFKWKNGKVLIAALLVFLMGIVLAIAGAGLL